MCLFCFGLLFGSSHQHSSRSEEERRERCFPGEWDFLTIDCQEQSSELGALVSKTEPGNEELEVSIIETLQVTELSAGASC